MGSGEADAFELFCEVEKGCTMPLKALLRMNTANRGLMYKTAVHFCHHMTHMCDLFSLTCLLHVIIVVLTSNITIFKSSNNLH